MKQLRLRAVLLVGWMVIFYVITHYLNPLNLISFSFVYALVSIAIILAVPQINKLNQFWLVVIPILMYLVFRGLVSRSNLNDILLITILETFTILITMLFLVWLLEAIREFDNVVADITIGVQDELPNSVKEGKSILYREVRRARNHQRPLTLMAVSVNEESIKGSVDRLVKDAQQKVIRQFMFASVSRTLCEKLEDCDIVVRTDDHFVIVLPETKPEDLPILTERIKKQVANDVGVELLIGAASLPHDGFTLEGLLEKATFEMQGTKSPELFNEPEKILMKNKAS
jgi:GGDEF domain-containing protein